MLMLINTLYFNNIQNFILQMTLTNKKTDKVTYKSIEYYILHPAAMK